MCLQLQSTLNNIIENNKPIIFNKCIINANPNINYDYNTGHFTINSNGIYYIRWWANIDSCYDSDYASFSIKSCRGHNIESCTTKMEQLCGDAIISVCNSHLDFSLINTSNSNVYLCPYTNLKANISIFKISNNYTEDYVI
jgi:hypothetical protein